MGSDRKDKAMKEQKTASMDSGHSPWRKAQEGEKEFWVKVTSNQQYLDKHADDFRSGIPRFLDQIRTAGLTLDDHHEILQIGCGLFDVIDFLPMGRKHAVDPLEDYFKSLHDTHRGLSVDRRQGMAEVLPFAENSMDLVISHNMLDHVSSARDVISECHRVLKPTGIFWLRVHAFAPLAVHIKEAILATGIDPKHLFFWSIQSLKELARDQRFDIFSEYTDKEVHSVLQCLRKGEWKPVVKMMMGISPTNLTMVLKPHGK